MQDAEALADQRHGGIRRAADVGADATEEPPVPLPPVGERTVPLPFLVREGRVDIAVATDGDLDRLGDAERSPGAIDNDVETSDLRDRAPLPFILPHEGAGGSLEAIVDELAEFIGQRRIVAIGINLGGGWFSVRAVGRQGVLPFAPEAQGNVVGR